MDTSYELLSSMSPKINKNQKPIRKPPTILALKKYFRKSLAQSNQNTAITDESVITIESSSSCSSSPESNRSSHTPIVISDSEISYNNDRTPSKKDAKQLDKSCTPEKKIERRLSQEKYTNIQHWVDEVNCAKHDVFEFSELSTVLDDGNSGFRKPETNIAASSTLLESNGLRFDEFFKRKKIIDVDCHSPRSCDDARNKTPNKWVKNVLTAEDNALINDSLISDDLDFQNNFKNMTIDDSLLTEDDSLHTRIQKKSINKEHTEISPEKCSVADSAECENLLDSLYGNSWRDKRDEILPSSEPRVKISDKNITKRAPNTERHVNKVSLLDNNFENDSNLLKSLQKARFKKALESPWAKTLKSICDSDTESDGSQKNEKLAPIRLDFDDDKRNDVERIKPSDSGTYKTNSHPKDVNKSKKKEPLIKIQSAARRTYSFLSSLSGSVPTEKCDISALIFRNNFKQQKEKLAAKLFELFNEKVFENLIPKDTPIEWSDRMRGTAGVCSCKKITRRTGAIERTAKITLATKVLDSADRLRDTLIHELCHAATWIVNEVSDGHGAFWKSWAIRAMKTFPELPPIKRCHNYVINTKYTYKCTGCAYSIGRHTKSLDVQRKRCGYCFGTFEVLINKVSKQGETRSVPVTPKKPSAFALFVKENYANFKTPQLKHGDVMKILGQEFANLKVDKA